MYDDPDEPDGYKLIPPERYRPFDGLRNALRILHFVFVLILGILIAFLYRRFNF